jgi:hypothetical protein
MSTPKAEVHAAKVKAIQDIMKKEPSLRELYTDELDQYFDKFFKAILRGDFEEIYDTPMFVEVGKDSEGFSLFYSLRGTNRNELFHQKMKTAIGPWRIGARTAHYLLVYLAYQFNIETGIRRCGEYDFGISELDIIDRIQVNIQEIYNVLIWPRHKNVSVLPCKPDFVSVGIGPLTYNPRFVEFGDPAEHLTGDLEFMASQMNLKYPILPIGSKEEVKIYNEFVKNKKPTPTNLEKLCEIFKEKSDGINIFPKIPSVLKSYKSTWEKNNEIRTKERKLGPEVKALLRRFFFSSTQPSVAQNLSISTGYEDDSGTVDTEIEKLCAHPPQIEDEHETNNISRPIVQVPPPQAPTQTTYVQAVPKLKRCAAWPWCTEMDCGETKFQCEKFGASLRNNPGLANQLKNQRDVKLRKERREKAKKDIT